MKINKLIDNHKLEFDNFYKRILERKLDKSLLAKAMKYSSIKGGKRIRAFLVSEASKIVNLSNYDCKYNVNYKIVVNIIIIFNRIVNIYMNIDKCECK